jgi:gas vesicle protein
MANNTGQTVLALLTGAAIGAGIGILYAPEKGSKTRENISKSAKKAQKELSKKLEETTKALGKKASAARVSFEEKLEDTISNASHKADDVLKALEEKLEELRAQNSKLQKK